jgi:hypothetical protein
MKEYELAVIASGSKAVMACQTRNSVLSEIRVLDFNYLLDTLYIKCGSVLAIKI